MIIRRSQIGRTSHIPRYGFLEIAFTVARNGCVPRMSHCRFRNSQTIDLTTRSPRSHDARSAGRIHRNLQPTAAIACRLAAALPRKMVHGSAEKSKSPRSSRAFPIGDGRGHLSNRDACGLHYGPAFLLRRPMTLHGGSSVNPGNLITSTGAANGCDAFRARSMRLMLARTAYRGCSRVARRGAGVAYIPMRSMKPYCTRLAPYRARFPEILKKSERRCW